MSAGAGRPAERRDAAGHSHVDYGAVWWLAGPLMANSAIQAVLNLTDTWFVSRLSTAATAAMGATYWIVLCAIILLGGVSMAVQTLAAQAQGAGRRARASQAAWSGLYAAALSVPLFAAIGLVGAPLLSLLDLNDEVQRLALEYWWPRLVVAGPLGLLVWALTGFFNGIGRARQTLLVTVAMGLANIPFNQFFIFRCHLGIAGAAWGTAAAEVVGLALALGFFFEASVRRLYRPQLTWRRPAIRRQFALGLPMGLGTTADLGGLALFQLMLVSYSTTAGAATQIAMMLTSIAYMPGLGIALAGMTLVGQSIGAGERDWARTVGNAIIRLAMAFMGIVGVLLAGAGPWLTPLFVNAADARAGEVAALAVRLLWLAAIYQVFDGLNLAASFCLRGAGDVRVPAVIIALLSWGLWVPLTHVFTFAPGHGWVRFLPQLGLGAIGGWLTSVVYALALGTALWWRWHSRAWQRIRL